MVKCAACGEEIRECEVYYETSKDDAICRHCADTAAVDEFLQMMDAKAQRNALGWKEKVA